MEEAQISKVFAALADPTRRDIVARLAVADATVNDRSSTSKRGLVLLFHLADQSRPYLGHLSIGKGPIHGL